MMMMMMMMMMIIIIIIIMIIKKAKITSMYSTPNDFAKKNHETTPQTT